MEKRPECKAGLLPRQENNIRRMAEALFIQPKIAGSWNDIVHDLTVEIDCLRYQAFWQGKGIAVIEKRSFLLVAKRWLALPRPSRVKDYYRPAISSSSKAPPADFQLREGFTMMRNEPLDFELEDTRDPNIWRTVMDSGQKDLVRDNY